MGGWVYYLFILPLEVCPRDAKCIKGTVPMIHS